MPLTSRLTILLLACMPLWVVAQPRESVEGVHYQALPKMVPTETPEDVIEVREIFWYGCPECFTLEPTTTTYRDGVRGDVESYSSGMDLTDDITIVVARFSG